MESQFEWFWKDSHAVVVVLKISKCKPFDLIKYLKKQTNLTRKFPIDLRFDLKLLQNPGEEQEQLRLS